MKNFLVVLMILLWGILFTQSASAISCRELDTNQKIKAFVIKAKESNPLNRENVSTHLEMTTKEKGQKKIEQVHSLRLNAKKRTVFLKGTNAPICAISLGKRDFKCNECTLLTNSQCRSFKSSEKSTTIRGTNIDTNDFKLLESKDFKSVCEEIPKKPNYLKITSSKVAGGSGYDQIVSYYDKKREVPVITNYSAQKVLRKVYRFFPKYYIQLKDRWISTVTRVRTTKGSEKKYTFETLIKVLKSRNNKYQIYLDPKNDPALKKANMQLIFNTK
jgi:hypothetical protein